MFSRVNSQYKPFEKTKQNKKKKINKMKDIVRIIMMLG